MEEYKSSFSNLNQVHDSHVLKINKLQEENDLLRSEIA